MTIYDIGDQVRLTATFTDSTGANADPTAVTCTVTKGDLSQTTPTVNNSAVGVYYVDVTLDCSGEWNYRFAGTGAVIGAEEGQFYVRQRRA